METLKDQHVLILGLGASGLAMARWCARCGARVTVVDTREAPPQLGALREGVPQAEFRHGGFEAALVEGSDVRAVFKSPGLTPASVAPLWIAAQAMGLWVGGELDLFVRALADLKQASAVEPEQEILTQETPAAPIATAEPDDEALPSEASDEEASPLPVDEEEAPLLAPAPPATGYAPKILAVTGTNGKTTVTALTGQLVERAGKQVAVAGNIGPSLLDTLAQQIDADALPEVWVLELSSFQLDAVQGFEPTAATVLNLSQDHLDWHGDMVAYAAAKARVFGEQGLMVLNRDDPAVMALRPAPAKTRTGRPGAERDYLSFGAGMPQRPGDYGIEEVNGMAWLVRAQEADETLKRRRRSASAAAGEEEELFIQRLMPVEALRIRGRHNATNALAALALAQAAGCPLGPMLFGLREYRGEPHRVEAVAVIDDVEYFDDSKGTNVGATVAALAGLGAERKLVPILGGDGKGQDFSPLAAPVARHARAVVLIGRDGPRIRDALQACGVPLYDAKSMEEAVKLAAEHASAGDAVLLSPACASFDMFDNYVHRAQRFCAAVQARADDAVTTRGGGL